MRSALLLISVVALAGCDDLFETNDHDYDFPSSGSSGSSVPTNVQPTPVGRFPSSSSSSSGTFVPNPIGSVAWTSTNAYVAIEASDHYTCALRASHQLDCWGDTLANPPTKLTDLSASAKTACGTNENGALQCWGAAQGFDAPIGGRLSHVSLGEGFACALDDENHPVCWGPKAITPPDEELRELAVGTNHACGIKKNDTGTTDNVVCWGNGKAAKAPKGQFKSIAAGAATSCALANFHVFCWGLLEGAQPSTSSITSIAVTLGKACGIRLSDQRLECWGLAQNSDWLEPPDDFSFSSLSIGVTHACGLSRDNGLAVCWGSNTSGESTPP